MMMLIKLRMFALHGQTFLSFIITWDKNQILEMDKVIPPPSNHKQSYYPHKKCLSWIKLKNIARLQQYQLLAANPFHKKAPSKIFDKFFNIPLTRVSIISFTWLFFLMNFRNSQCYQANIYLFTVNNRNTRKRCKIYSELTIKTPKLSSSVSSF